MLRAGSWNVAVGVFLVVLVSGDVLALVAGWSLWLPLVVGFAPLAVLVRRRIGGAAAVALTVLGLCTAVLGGLMLTAGLHWSIVIFFVVLSFVLGVGAAVLLFRVERAMPRPPTPPRPGPAAHLAWIAPLAGPALFAAALVLARLRSHGAVLSWAMNGDSANNILLMRAQIYADGIRLGPLENPVPLPTGLVAVASAADRGGTPPSSLLAHDVGSMVAVWAVLIALICLLFGVVAQLSVGSDRSIVRVVAGAAGSVFALSWYAVGYSIDFGYLGAHVALAVMLCVWIVMNRTVSRPWFAIGVAGVSSALLLATWTPLALFPAALGAVLLRSAFSTVGARGGRIFALVGASSTVAVAAGLTLPSFAAQGSALSLAGAGYPIFAVLPAALVVLTIGSAIVLLQRGKSLVAANMIAVAVAAVIADGSLIYLARAQADPWLTYYPAKFAWLSSLVFAAILLDIGFGSITRLRMPAHRIVATAVVLAVSAVVLAQVPGRIAGPVPLANPLIKIVKGDYLGPGTGDRVATTIFRYVDIESPSLLWRSGIPNEPFVDFWAMLMQANSIEGHFRLRYLAYGNYRLDSVPDLCRIVGLMGGRVRIVTRDPGLAGEVSRRCPEQHTVVSLLP